MSEEEVLHYINMKISFLKSNVSDKFRFRHGNSTDDLEALQGILDLYKREKEKNKELEEKRKTTMEVISANYIHKDKIKEKIEYWKEERYIAGEHLVVKILQELLEGD